MADTQTVLTILDGNGAEQVIYAITDGIALTPQSVPRSNGAAVTTANPLPVADSTGNLGIGAPADAVWSGTGSGSIIAILKAIWTAVTGTLTFKTASVTPAAPSGSLTLTTGGTAQALASTGSVLRMLIVNNPSTASLQGIVTAESVFVNVVSTATNTAGGQSIEILPGEKWSFNLGILTAVSWNAPTTGHKINAVIA